MKLLPGFTKITWWILWFMRNEHQPAASGHWSSHWVTVEWSWLVSPPIGVIQESSWGTILQVVFRGFFSTLITGMYWEDTKKKHSNNPVSIQESHRIANSGKIYYTYLHFGQDHRQARLEIMGPKNYSKSTDWASIITHYQHIAAPLLGVDLSL